MLGTSNSSTIWGIGNTAPNHKRTSNIKNKFVAVLLTLVTIIAFGAIETSQFSTASAHGTHPNNDAKPIVWMRGGVFGNNRPNYRQNERNAPRIYIGFQRSHFATNERDGPAVNIKYKITDTSNFIKDRSIVGVTRTYSFAHNANTSWKGPSFETQDDFIDEIIIDVEDYDEMGNLKPSNMRTGRAEGEVSAMLPRPIKIEILEDPAYHIVGSDGAMAADRDYGSVNCDYDDNKVPGIHFNQFHDSPHARCAAIYYKFEDDDKPSAKIVANTRNGTGGLVPEDSGWQFKVELNILPARNISIPITVTPDSPNLVGTFFKTLPTEVEFGPNNNCGATPPCEVRFDIINQTNGLNSFSEDTQFTVTFGTIPPADNFKYGLHNNNNNQTMIMVADDGAPLLTMTSDKKTLTEGTDSNIGIKFNIAGTAPTSAITVLYTINQNGLDFIDSDDTGEVMISVAEFATNEYSHTIGIDDDTVNEKDSIVNDFGLEGSSQTRTIDITLAINTGYTISTTTAEKTLSFTIRDNDLPEISLSLPLNNNNPITSYTEGSRAAEFTLQASIAPWRAISVNFTADDGPQDCLSRTRRVSVTGTNLVSGNIVENDDVDEVNCNVVVTLTARAGIYSIHATNNVVRYTVVDNDISLVEFKLGTGSGRYSETSTTQFTLEIPDPAPHDISVNFTVVESDSTNPSDFISSIRSAIIPQGQTEVAVDVLESDDIEETSEEDITVTLTADTANPALYEIPDISNISDRSITFTVFAQRANTVIMSMSSDKLALNESENIGVKFTVSSDPTSDLVITYTINQNGLDFLASDQRQVSISMSEWSNRVYAHEIPIHDDNRNEKDSVINDFDENRTIDVTLTSNTGYEVTGTTENTLNFTIRDNDIPEVSIRLPVDNNDNPVTTYTEGSTDAEFFVQASITPWRDINVNFNAEVATGNCIDPTRGIVVNGSAPVQVNLVYDDNFNEVDCEVKVTLTAGEAGVYSIHAMDYVVEYTVENDDTGEIVQLPQISISQNNGTVTEGDSSIEYTLMADPVPNGNITILLSITESGSMILGTPELQIDMPSSGMATGTVMLDDDNVYEEDSTISIRVVHGENYEPTSNSIANSNNSNTITIVVLDDEANSISISPGPAVDAGNFATFQLLATEDVRARGLNLQINVTQDGSFIAFRAPRSFKMTSREDIIKIQTFNDASHSGNGSITVTLIENPAVNYRINEDFSGTATVTVNQTSTTVDPNRIAVANKAVESVLTFLETSQSRSPSVSQTNPSENTNIDTNPIVSINSSRLSVNEGETVYFQISTTYKVSNHISVEVTVTGNTIESSRTAIVNIKSGERIGILPVSTINDDKPNEDRTITATVQTGTMYELGQNKSATVIVSDFEDQNRVRNALTGANQEVLPEIFSTIESQTSNAIDGRVEQYFNNESGNSWVINGGSQFTDILTSSGGTLANDTLTLREVMGNSSFSFDLFQETGIANSTTIWGLGNIQDISGYQSAGQQTWAGNTFIGQFGFDARISENTLTGVTYSFSDAKVNYVNFQDDQISYKSYTSGLHPYFGWKSNDGGTELSIQTGYGLGDVEIEYEDIYNGRLGTRYYTIAVESSKNLVINEDLLSGTTSELNLIFDSDFSQQSIESRDRLIDDSRFEFWNIDLATEGKQSSKIFESATLDRSLSIGLKRKYSIDESLFGIGTNTSFDYSNSSGINVSGLGNLTIPFENQIQGSIQGSLNFDRNQDQLGTQFEILGIYGNTDQSNAVIFELNRTDYFDSNNLDTNEINQRLISEIGYGFSVFDSLGSIIPYSGMTLTNGSISDYRLGSVLKLGSNIELGLIGKNSSSSNGTNGQSIELDGKINW